MMSIYEFNTTTEKQLIFHVELQNFCRSWPSDLTKFITITQAHLIWETSPKQK